MMERAKAKKQNGKAAAQQPEENAEVYGIDALVELGRESIRRTGRGVKKTVRGVKKTAKTVKNLRHRMKTRKTIKQRKQALEKTLDKTRLQRQRIKTRSQRSRTRNEKPPDRAAFPSERLKTRSIKRRKIRLKTRKDTANRSKAERFRIKKRKPIQLKRKLKKLGKLALHGAAYTGKTVVKKTGRAAKNAAKSGAKSALQEQLRSHTADQRGLDETLAYGKNAAGLTGRGIKKAAKAGKKAVDKRRGPDLRNGKAAAQGHAGKNRLPAHESGNPSVRPKQRGKMETAKSRQSLAKPGSAIKNRANAAKMQPKGKANAFKNIASKRKQIKKAKVVQQQAQQKAQMMVKAAAKRSIAMMKQVVQAAAAAIKSIIAAVGGFGLFIILFLLIFIIGFLAASPFGMFMSDDNPKNGRPLAEVIAELDGELRISASTGDELDNEGETVASNWMDVIAVFAVKTTTTTTEKALDVGVMDEERVQKLREVLNDMNEVTTRQETETYTDENGDEQTRSKTVTSVVGKTWRDMIPIYGFDRDQQALLEEIMSDEYFDMLMLLLGEAGLSGAPMTSEELQDIINNLPPASSAAAAEIVRLAASRLGHPYSQELRGQGNYVDCSYFTRWIYRHFSIEMPGTAVEQARWCAESGLAIAKSDLQVGDLVFWSYGNNGRYRGIDHVGVYIGNGMVIDASKSKGKVVKRNIFDSGNQVMYGRPLAYGGG